MQRKEQEQESFDFRTYDTDWDSEAYLTVAGQNSNNSVRLTNDFVQRVLDDKRMGPHSPHRWQACIRRCAHVRSGTRSELGRLGLG